MKILLQFATKTLLQSLILGRTPILGATTTQVRFYYAQHSPFRETRKCGIVTADVCDTLGRDTSPSSCLYEDARNTFVSSINGSLMNWAVPSMPTLPIRIRTDLN